VREPAPEFVTAAGFPEMWRPFTTRIRAFDCAFKLQPIVCDMLNRPVEGHLLQKLLYDTLDEKQKQEVTPEQYQRIMDDYNRVLPDFLNDRKNQILRNEWCKESLYKRAKEAGPEMLFLYRTFYRHASSMHHMDVGGVISTIESEMHAHTLQ
jgi:hypothetical protein